LVAGERQRERSRVQKEVREEEEEEEEEKGRKKEKKKEENGDVMIFIGKNAKPSPSKNFWKETKKKLS